MTEGTSALHLYKNRYIGKNITTMMTTTTTTTKTTHQQKATHKLKKKKESGKEKAFKINAKIEDVR